MSHLRPHLDAIFPPDAARAAARCGAICLVLAISVAFLFPAEARAGTEVAVARWITAGALAAAWAAFTFSGGRLTVIGAGLVALAAGALVAPAPWLALVAAGSCIYVASALIPRVAHPAEPEPAAHPVQDFLESLGIALVLALVVREFGFEAFKIPTGSMVPTILGDDQAVNRRGDRLLAFKMADYRRWDIVVFRFPLFRQTNFIKRLVGLPGERLEIRDGDLYAGPKGEELRIAAKPDDVQEVLWAHDASGRPAVRAGDMDDWSHELSADESEGWNIHRGGADVSAQGEGVAWADLKRGTGASSLAPDLRVSFDLDTGGSAAGDLFVSLEGGQREIVFQVSQYGCEVKAPGATWTPRESVSLGPTARLAFSVADRVIRIYRDGRMVARFAHEDMTNGASMGGRVRIGARNLTAKFRNLTVEEDTQYRAEGSALTSFDIPDDSYLMFGDNTRSSHDSRLWTARVIRTKSGEEYVCPGMARIDDDTQEQVYRTLEGGSIEFRDSYGVLHTLSPDQIASNESGVHQPFVKDTDLVGRAFFVFFPFPPFSSFRPRFLR